MRNTDSASALEESALTALRGQLDSMDEKNRKILSYWIRDYVKFLKKEKSFDPQKIISYQRGSVVKVHLGYRIGNEEGGLHYAIVIDRNEMSSGVVAIVPLTSVKPSTDIEHLHRSNVFLGNEIFNLLNAEIEKVTADLERIKASLVSLVKFMKTSLQTIDDTDKTLDQRIALRDRILSSCGKISALEEKSLYLIKMEREVQKMKRGSIALVGQITTVSKIRIYDPIYPNDVLSHICISPASMDKLDEKICKLFTK